MPCYHLITAYQGNDGAVVFAERVTHGSMRTLSLPCGQCIGCRLESSRQWAVRCVHEASLYEDNCFLTLTYSDVFLPHGNSLVYRDFQLFMKRLRKRFALCRIRFYMCGEYGECCVNCGQSRVVCQCGNWLRGVGRPHYHACLFGFTFADKVLHCRTGAGFNLYTSVCLDELWGKGFCSIGDVTFESAAYVARYIVKKMNGDLAEGHYGGRMPEFCHMSLKPGIGALWFDKFHKDVFPGDYVVVNGVKVKPPKYYDKRFCRMDEDTFAMVSCDRERGARERFGDNSDDRLVVKEVVHKARVRYLRREL